MFSKTKRMIHRIINPTLSNMITATDIIKDNMRLDGILHRLRYKETISDACTV